MENIKLIILLVLISLIILPVNVFASDTNDIFKTPEEKLNFIEDLRNVKEYLPKLLHII